MELSRLLEIHPWYAQHIYAAMSRFLENCPFTEQSSAFLQCRLIRDAAEKDSASL